MSEPGLAEFIRAFLSLSVKTRRALEKYLRESSDPRLIGTRTRKNGDFALFPPPATGEPRTAKTLGRH
jgi:hypothetical protein